MLKQPPLSGSVKLEPAPKAVNISWKNQLVQRPYRFPASCGTGQELSVHINHDGTAYYFPLGTPDAQQAAAKASQIYHVTVKQGWNTTCRQFSRELTLSFEWCMNPVLWTYTTIHTLVDGPPKGKYGSLPPSPNRQRIMVVETDAGVRRALCWCIDQQEGFASVPCESMESYQRTLAQHRPRLVLFNRTLAERIDLKSARSINPLQPNILVLTYSVHADGDQMFARTPSGVGGYLIKRARPGRLLDPITKVASRPELISEEFLLRVKYHFQELLELQSSHDTSALEKLTQREKEVLMLMSKGCADKEIAQTMGISAWTVHGHVKNIFERLQVRSRTEAVIRYLEK